MVRTFCLQQENIAVVNGEDMIMEHAVITHSLVNFFIMLRFSYDL